MGSSETLAFLLTKQKLNLRFGQFSFSVCPLSGFAMTILAAFILIFCGGRVYSSELSNSGKQIGSKHLIAEKNVPASKSRTEFGLCFHHAEEYNLRSSAVLDDLRKSGRFWLRGDFHKPALDRQFSRDMKSKGIDVLGLIYWYKKSPKGWEEYVKKEVMAAPDLPAWEVCNEPEMSWWGGPISAKDYMKMLKQAHAIIRKANPDAIIVGPAVGATSEGIKYLSSLIDMGLLNYVDAISAHYYIFHKNTDINGIKKLVAGRKPIWITETGWTTADQPGGEAAQAKYINKYYNRINGILGSDPEIQVIFNYELNDDHYPLLRGKDDGWGLTCGAKGKFLPKKGYGQFKSLLAN